MKVTIASDEYEFVSKVPLSRSSSGASAMFCSSESVATSFTPRAPSKELMLRWNRAPIDSIPAPRTECISYVPSLEHSSFTDKASTPDPSTSSSGRRCSSDVGRPQRIGAGATQRSVLVQSPPSYYGNRGFRRYVLGPCADCYIVPRSTSGTRVAGRLYCRRSSHAGADVLRRLLGAHFSPNSRLMD